MQAILAKLHAAGHFYKAAYEGFYSTKEETFLTEKDRLPDGTFDPAYGEVVELEEENYYFKLKDHQQWLIDYIEQNPTFMQPDYRRNEVLGFLKNNESGGPLHQPAGGAVELGHSPAVRSRLRHLRLVRRAGELHHHSRRAR